MVMLREFPLRSRFSNFHQFMFRFIVHVHRPSWVGPARARPYWIVCGRWHKSGRHSRVPTVRCLLSFSLSQTSVRPGVFPPSGLSRRQDHHRLPASLSCCLLACLLLARLPTCQPACASLLAPYLDCVFTLPGPLTALCPRLTNGELALLTCPRTAPLTSAPRSSHRFRTTTARYLPGIILVHQPAWRNLYLALCV